MAIDFDPDLVSIVVRTVSPKRLPQLREAIASIYANPYRPIEVVVVIQSADTDHVEAVKALLHQFEIDYETHQFALKTVVNPTQEDQRAKNLNLGMAAAQGRYVGFLDDDDVFYPNHIDDLMAALSSADAPAWAYGDVALAQCRIDAEGKLQKTLDFPFRHHAFSLSQFFRHNLIPIHTFLLDRARIDGGLLQFDESFSLGEDYIFLLKIAARHPPVYVKTLVSEYRVFEDLSNSNTIMNTRLGRPDKAKIKAWNYALWRTEKLKETLMPGYGGELLSLKRRKYVFYWFPGLKIMLQYNMPTVRRFFLRLIKFLNIME